MDALNWMGTGEMVALGWTLLHFCWQGTALAIVYGVLDRMTRHASAQARYAVALAVLATMPVAAIGTFLDQQRLVVHISRGDHAVVASQLGTMHGAIVKDIPLAAPIVQESELWIAWNADRLLPWVDGIWLCGVLLLAVRALGGWWQLERVRRRAKGMVPAEVLASFRRVHTQLRMTQKVALRVSDEVISPLAMGVWRAAVILPSSAIAQLQPEALEAVLAHELAHIRRWDYLANLLQTAVECLLFFHPAVWWLSHRTRDLRETCCDAMAARSCADPVIYAEALLRLEEQRTEKLRLAVALHGRGGTLLVRVKQILGEGITMESRMMSGMRVAVAGAVLMGLLLGPKMAKGLKKEQSDKVVPVAAELHTGAPVMISPMQAEPDPQPQPAAELQPRPAASAVPEAAPAPLANPAPMPQPAMAAAMATMDQEQVKKQGGMTFLAGMKDAGYTLDLDKDLNEIVALRSVGVTPEYAKAMAQAGYGTPSLRDLIGLKSVGVTPEYARSIAQAGYGTPALRDLVGLKSVGVTPEYAKSIAQAGYGTPALHDLVGLKSVGVTPEYAKSIAQIGIGTPTLRDLIGLKSVGVTPEYVAGLKNSGIAPTSLREVISQKSLGITPEYAKAMAALGFGNPTSHDLVGLKSQGITPEYVAELKAAGIAPGDLHELVSMKAVGVTPEFAKGMAASGFSNLSSHELVSLKAQGASPEYLRWLKQNFPDADLHGVRQAMAFHIDQDFIAKAKAHGFNNTSLDKLTKLKMSGLLED